MVQVANVEVIVSHHERATVRVGDVFLKIDGDDGRLDVEVGAMRLAPVPTPEIRWRRPNVLALGRVGGEELGLPGVESTASPAAWAAAGAAARALHAAPLPPWPGWSLDEFRGHLGDACTWLLDRGVVPPDVVHAHRALAEIAIRPWTPVFTHGDYQSAHVFVDGDTVSGIIDWADACQGDALYDLAVLTAGHGERLDDVERGYGADLDRDVIRGWWSFRRLASVRWMTEHGFDPVGDIAALNFI
jgi:aminoglycoside phosphotransferase (APT) family kinase protein